LKAVFFCQLLGQSLENWKQGELPQEEVQKFHATVLTLCETALSYLKIWTDKSSQDLESYSWVSLNRTPSCAATERTLSLVINIVPSVQLAENEVCDEYVYMKQFVTGEKVSE
jgi:hypothetical protein